MIIRLDSHDTAGSISVRRSQVLLFEERSKHGVLPVRSVPHCKWSSSSLGPMVGVLVRGLALMGGAIFGGRGIKRFSLGVILYSNISLDLMFGFTESK